MYNTITIKMKQHLLWLVLLIIFAIAIGVTFFYGEELQKQLKGNNQGLIWVIITMGLFVSIIYYGRT
jgi:hypothetical protein